MPVAADNGLLKVVQVITDTRRDFGEYDRPDPSFGTAPEALLQGLARRKDVEVHVLSCTPRRVRAPERLAENIRFHSLLVPKPGWMWTGYQGCIRAVRRKVRALQPDVVHGQGTERDCALAAAMSGAASLVTLHGNMRQVARVMGARPFSFHWLAARLEPFALRRAGGVLCNTAYTEEMVRPLNSRVWRVPNAMREIFFRPNSAAPRSTVPRLACVGVIRELKRPVELLAAMERLQVSGVKFRLEFAGRAEAHTEYGRRFSTALKRAEAQGWASHVGELPASELVEWLDGAAALVHGSEEESFGLAIAEGLARNLKFFGFSVGGVPEVASGVEGAELFAPHDWEGMTGAVAKWLAAGAQRPATAANEMSARYHPDVVAERHVAIYRELKGRSS
jgi:glycosyltransferase involved in cell wall biosynthesis